MNDLSQLPLPPTPKIVKTDKTVRLSVVENVIKKFFENHAVQDFNSKQAFDELWKLLNETVDKEENNSNNARSGDGVKTKTAEGPEPPVKRENKERLIQEMKAREKAENDLKTVINERNYFVNLNNELNMEKTKLEQTVNLLNQNNSKMGEQLEKKRKEYSDLHKKNLELKDEASQYQSALGDARNYRLSDNDANNPTQLTKVIDNMQEKFKDFCKVKGGVDVNEPQLDSLLNSYKCTITEPGDKVLYKAALQRHIIETIIAKTEEYLKAPTKEINDMRNKIKEKYLELDVLISTDGYLSKLKHFIDSREGTDEVSIEAPKKIRQLVYAMLGDRGFGLNKDKREHEFIQELKGEIIKKMNNFRTIKNADKRKENEDMIADILRDTIKMFFFRIRVLEPPGVLDWIPNGNKVDSTLMEVGSLDENYEDLVVNLCNFPLISVKTGNDRKVLVLAKINATPKRDHRRISAIPHS